LLTCNAQVSTSSSDDEEDDDGLFDPTGDNEPIYEQDLGGLDELHEEKEPQCMEVSNIEHLQQER